MSVPKLTHVAGTFLVQASGAFLNGAGLGEGENRTVTIPKTFRDGRDLVPYVSAQAWKRWLRNTLIEETGWMPSVLKPIGSPSVRGTTTKISGELNPVDYAEDDIFGYMRAEKGQGSKAEEDEDEEDEEGAKPEKGQRVKAVMRSSPFAASLMVSIRKSGWQGRDEAFVHLKEGTPLPYVTEFYNTHLQAVFCLNYSRMGVFSNIGDRIELDDKLVDDFIKDNKVKVLEDLGKSGKKYGMADGNARAIRGRELFKALALLRGGAKQAQFGTDVAPKAIVMAGLSCGNPIFNNVFDENVDGPVIKVNLLKEIIKDYSEKLVTPVVIGLRTGYLKNEEEVRSLGKQNGSEVFVMTPIEAARKIGEYLM